MIRHQVRSIFFHSRDTYGHRMIRAEMLNNGFCISYRDTLRIMYEEGLKALPFVKKTNPYSKNILESITVPNRLKRKFSPKRVDRYWAGDITYIWTDKGWVYLAVVVDLYSRRIIGWATSERPDTDLIVRALESAMQTRSPRRWRIMFHSDQGCQYGSKMFRAKLKEYGILQSMSRRGNCWDNAVVEIFFGTLKQETGLNKIFARNTNELEWILYDWIESWYNSNRKHSTLGNVSPLSFEKTKQAA